MLISFKMYLSNILIYMYTLHFCLKILVTCHKNEPTKYTNTDEDSTQNIIIYSYARAMVITVTEWAFPSSKTRAHSLTVLPVVRISSTSIISLFFTR